MSRSKMSTHIHPAAAPPPRPAGTLVDRWLVTLVLLAAALACAVVFLVSAGVLTGADVVSDVHLRERVFGFAEGRYRVAVAIGSALLGLGTTLMALRRHAGPPAGPGLHVLSTDERGCVVVQTPAIATLVEAAVLRTPGVVGARARIRGHGTGPVRLRVDAQVLGGTELPRAGDSVREAARRAAVQLAGIDVHDVVVRLDVLRPDQVEVE